jgi:alanyl-tRNA synthetase
MNMTKEKSVFTVIPVWQKPSEKLKPLMFDSLTDVINKLKSNEPIYIVLENEEESFRGNLSKAIEHFEKRRSNGKNKRSRSY